MANLNFSTTSSPQALPDYEYSGNYLNFFFWDGISENRILYSLSDNYISIWAESDASLTNGKLYISTQGELSVINLSTNTLYDRYDMSNKGRGEETLLDNIDDMNVV